LGIESKSVASGHQDVSWQHCKLAFSPAGELVTVAGKETINVKNTKM
jgi:hypothetical protein